MCGGVEYDFLNGIDRLPATAFGRSRGEGLMVRPYLEAALSPMVTSSKICPCLANRSCQGWQAVRKMSGGESLDVIGYGFVLACW